MTQHSPTPWAVDECADAHGLATVRFDDGSVNGDIEAEPIATVGRYSDAAYIVKACNAYPALVEALRGLLADVEEYGLVDHEGERITFHGAADLPSAMKAREALNHE